MYIVEKSQNTEKECNQIKKKKKKSFMKNVITIKQREK